MNLLTTAATASWRRLVLLSSSGITLAAALYAAFHWDSSAPLAMLEGGRDPNRVDLFIEQVHGVKFGADGKLSETLHAQRLDHYPERNESVIAAPQLDMPGSDGKMWNISANTGVLVGDTEIRLQQNVVAVDSTRTLSFQSEQLNYFSDKHIATTDAPVTLRHTADVTTAVGMRADLNTNRIELMRNVDSRYVQTR